MQKCMKKFWGKVWLSKIWIYKILLHILVDIWWSKVQAYFLVLECSSILLWQYVLSVNRVRSRTIVLKVKNYFQRVSGLLPASCSNLKVRTGENGRTPKTVDRKKSMQFSERRWCCDWGCVFSSWSRRLGRLDGNNLFAYEMDAKCPRGSQKGV